MDITAVDNLWLLTASFLVLLMQAGFLLLEGGRVRSKNSINVAQKNVADLLIAWISYFLFGFVLMYGISMPLRGDASPSPLHFVFQLGFCATAASIVSGGVAERMKFLPYLALALVMGGFLYPLVGRLVWGDTFINTNGSWLADIGYVDFAGASVVHLVGGCSAFVAILFIGARTDRFDSEGNLLPIQGHNTVMALQGALILLFGWIGFNAGTISVADPKFQEVIVNTLSAAAFGGAGGMLVGIFLDRGLFNPARTINGLIGGLVTSTAAIHAMHPYESMLYGFLGGALATYAGHYLLVRWKLDDPVDVVATHGVAGIFGTLIFALVAPVELLVNGSRIYQFGIQLIGVLVIMAIAAITISATLKLMSMVIGLRVTKEEELLGLNYTEHGESIGTDRLQQALSDNLAATDASQQRIALDPGDEHSNVAVLVNQLIEKQESARAAIHKSEQKFQQYAETASDWLWECTADGTLTTLSRVQDNAREDQLSTSNTKLLDLLIVGDADRQSLAAHLKAGDSFGPLEASLPFAGEILFVEVRGSANLDADGDLVCFRGTFNDITAHKLAEEKAVQLSIHDELTGLYNRRALQQSLARELKDAQKKLQLVALVGIDLDGFKAVNDSFGHVAGDDLLQSVAERIQAALFDGCSIYRTGGDEFVLVISELERANLTEKVSALTERVLQDIKLPFALMESDVQIGASLGVAIFPDDAMNGRDLLRRADLAMYSAKFQGKSRVVWFDPSLDDEMDHRFKLENELKRAIENKEIYLLYQPLVDTQTGKLLSFEALVRWRHPQKGELAPHEFLPVIEKHSLMNLLGTYVLEMACEFASTWEADEEGAIPRVSVNVSPSQFKSNEFADGVVDILRRYDFDPHQLDLEVTEETLIENHQATMAVISKLQQLGIHFSIDDFGTGQTSLQYLSDFPVNTLKIDRSFVKGIGSDGRSSEIARSMIAMGARLGYSVVAEGVEDSSQLDTLKEWNCPVVQGYFFSKPVGVDEVTNMLDSRSTGFSADKLRKAG